jgi:fatty acid desaturase
MMVLNMVVGSLLAALAHYLFQVRPWRSLKPEPVAPHCALPRFPSLINIACGHITYHVQHLIT